MSAPACMRIGSGVVVATGQSTCSGMAYARTGGAAGAMPFGCGDEGTCIRPHAPVSGTMFVSSRQDIDDAAAAAHAKPSAAPWAGAAPPKDPLASPRSPLDEAIDDLHYHPEQADMRLQAAEKQGAWREWSSND